MLPPRAARAAAARLHQRPRLAAAALARRRADPARAARGRRARPASPSCRWTRASTPGPILLQEALPIAPDDTAGTLHDKLARARRAAAGRGARREPRAAPAGCRAPRPTRARIDKDEAEIDWRAAGRGNRAPGARIRSRCRARRPRSTARSLKIWRARVERGVRRRARAPCARRARTASWWRAARMRCASPNCSARAASGSRRGVPRPASRLARGRAPRGRRWLRSSGSRAARARARARRAQPRRRARRGLAPACRGSTRASAPRSRTSPTARCAFSAALRGAARRAARQAAEGCAAARAAAGRALPARAHARRAARGRGSRGARLRRARPDLGEGPGQRGAAQFPAPPRAQLDARVQRSDDGALLAIRNGGSTGCARSTRALRAACSRPATCIRRSRCA